MLAVSLMALSPALSVAHRPVRASTLPAMEAAPSDVLLVARCADGDEVALTRPPHVNIDEIVVKALAQSSGGRIVRSG